MATRKLQPQECEGSYRFSGRIITTALVREKLTPFEINAIYQTVKAQVKEKNGIDYLQVFVNENGEKLYFIDNLNDDMIAGRNFDPENNYCTLMFAYEY
jgi:hypothetical protein